MTVEDPSVLTRVVVVRSSIIFGLAALPLLVLQEFRLLLGLGAGTALALANFSLLKVPVTYFFRLPSSGSRPRRFILPIVLSLLRFALVAAGIIFLIRWHRVNVAGLFIGIAIPLVAISSLIVFQWSLRWKV